MSLSLDDLYDYTELSQVALSPDGERLAVLADEFDEANDERRTSLFVAPADGSRPPHRLTRASAAGNPRWGPDGDRLAFVAAREEDVALKLGPDDGDGEDGDGGSGQNGDPTPQVWVFDLALGGDARQATTFERGVSDFDWSPDGDRLVVAARDPTEAQQAYLDEKDDGGPIEVTRLQHKVNGQGWQDDVRTSLFVVDVASREPRRLDEAYDAGGYASMMRPSPRWGEGGIAYLTNPTDNPDDSAVTDVYLVQPEGGAPERLTDGDRWLMAPTWSPDGDRLAVVGRDPPMNWYTPAEAYVVELDGTTRSVTPALDRTVMMSVGWEDDETVLTTIGDEARTRLVRAPADGSGAERVFESQGTDETVMAFDANRNGVALGLSAPDAPTDAFTLDGDLEARTRVSDLNAEFVADLPTPEFRRVHFENSDGEAIEGLAFLPDGFDPETDDPRPLVTFIHGGPMSYDRPMFDFKRTYFTGKGYVALCVNYRGSTSYGRAFSEALRGSRGDLESDDVLSGVETLVDLGWADPDRLFCTGFSYGGITSAHIAVREHPFAAIAPEHGIYDFTSTFGTDDNHLWHDDEFGLPWEAPETYEEISSLSRVGNVDTPLLVTAGENDWRCPPTQAEQLYVSVRKQGVPAKLVVYQNEHHNVGKPERLQHRLETLAEWFEKHDPTTTAEA